MRYLHYPVSVLALMAAPLLFGCSSDDSTDKLVLSSPSIQAGKPLPYEFTCNEKAFGDGSSPELNWSNAPSGTKSYAILLKDLTIESGESVSWLVGQLTVDQRRLTFASAMWRSKGGVDTLDATRLAIQTFVDRGVLTKPAR